MWQQSNRKFRETNPEYNRDANLYQNGQKSWTVLKKRKVSQKCCEISVIYAWFTMAEKAVRERTLIKACLKSRIRLPYSLKLGYKKKWQVAGISRFVTMRTHHRLKGCNCDIHPSMALICLQRESYFCWSPSDCCRANMTCTVNGGCPIG